MTRSPRAGSGLAARLSGPREPFDWALFFRTLPFQPAPLWFALSALSLPFSRAAPWLLGASCAEPLRTTLRQIVLIVYTLSTPPAAAVLVYLGFGRRRLGHLAHRRIGDWTLALILLVTALSVWTMGRSARGRWELVGGALRTVRAACWE